MNRLFAFLGVGLLSFSSLQGADDYPLGTDSQRQEGVPRGTVTQHTWNSEIFPGTVRDYWIYVPAQYDGQSPACLMVFQDGGGYVREDGRYRVPVVFDNLIHKKEMPITIALMINPGVVPAPNDRALPRYNRSFEYDGLGDRYARFLLEEMIPELEKTYRITSNPAGKAIGGASSGAICAFTVAWERPDSFSKVFSTIGTFVGLRGGNIYPTLIRKTEPKPFRIFLQDGSNDQNIYGGNWFLANQDMVSALEFSGYDFKVVWGEGGHNSIQGSSVFPDALRWLWRDYPNPVGPASSSKQPLTQILLPGENWELVGEGYGFTEGPAVNDQGEVFFTDIPNGTIYKINSSGCVETFARNSPAVNGLMFGADGLLYACQNGTQRIVSYDADGRESVVLEGIASNDLATTPEGGYVTDPTNKQVWYVDGSLNKRIVDTGIGFPNGVLLSPDQSLLFVSDTNGQFVYSFQIQSDGSLTHKQAYFHLHIPDGATSSGADGMTVDTQGNLYVTSRLGLQVFDQAGRVNGIISKPQNAWLSNVVFGGKNLDTLYVTCGDKVYKRKTKAQGVRSFRLPLSPARPRL